MPEGKQLELWLSRENVPSWHAPSASECASCHVDAAGYVLGLNTAQLNRPAKGEKENQISAWAKKGILELPENFEIESAAKFCSPHDKSEDVETRARVWLDVNCAMCHQPNGPGNANIDLRYATDLEKTKTIGVRSTQGDLGVENGLLISPGKSELSLLIHRVETKSVGRMPSIGSNQVDKKAVKLLKEWVDSMKP